VIQRTEDTATNAELTTSPRYQAKLNLIAPLYPEKIFAGLELLYYSPVSTLAGQRLDGHTLLNFTLFSREIVKGLQFSGSVYNLLNTHYAYPGAAEHTQDAILQDGRSFRIKFTYRF
jgi:iron complex outermembrane receptor protein